MLSSYSKQKITVNFSLILFLWKCSPTYCLQSTYARLKVALEFHISTTLVFLAHSRYLLHLIIRLISFIFSDGISDEEIIADDLSDIFREDEFGITDTEDCNSSRDESIIGKKCKKK